MPMWIINGTPHIVKTVASMDIGEEGSIYSENVLLSIKGELFINLDASLNPKVEKIDDYDEEDEDEDEDEEDEDDDEDDEDDDYRRHGRSDEDYLFTDFNIQRFSLEKDGYLIDIDGKYLKATSDTPLYNTIWKRNYVSLGIIHEFNEAFPTNLTHSDKHWTSRKEMSIKQFKKLSLMERRGLPKDLLKKLLDKATEKEDFEIAITLKELMKEC